MQRSFPRWVAILGAVVFFAGVSALHMLFGQRSSQHLPKAAQKKELSLFGAGQMCSSEDGIDYNTTTLYTNSEVPSWRDCRDRCMEDSSCGAWTWGRSGNKDVQGVCFLKQSPTSRPSKYRYLNEDVVSGLICSADSRVESKSPTLFCWAVMQAQGYEVSLMAMQYHSRVSLFACDEYAVYSNATVPLGRGIQSSIVDINLEAPIGGEFWTAMNTGIFLSVWEEVVAAGTYKRYDWTVKVDPDCAFFPERLRRVVSFHPEGQKGVYLKNCKYGLHGPIEVFSRDAVTNLHAGVKDCKASFAEACNGTCAWGEDLWIDMCLGNVLKVRHDDDWRLLVEDHCDPPANWRSCESTQTAAFHPFKDADEYRKCISSGQTKDAAMSLLK